MNEPSIDFLELLEGINQPWWMDLIAKWSALFRAPYIKRTDMNQLLYNYYLTGIKPDLENFTDSQKKVIKHILFQIDLYK